MERLIRAEVEAQRWQSPLHIARLLNPKFKQRAHLDLILDAFRGIVAGRLDRVLIECPPQTGKSITTRAGMLYALKQKPDWRIAGLSYSLDLAQNHGRALRNTIDGHPELGLKVAPDSAAQSRWDLAGHAGGFVGAGVGGSLTGKSVHLAVIDDPVKGRKEADSPVMQQTAIDWYRETVETRLQDEGAVVVLMTRWSEQDLAGKLMAEEGDRWHRITVPGLAEDHDVMPDDADLLTWQCPCGGREVHDPLGREPGVPLPHPLLSPEEYAARLHRQREVSPRTFYALSQQRPRPQEGGYWSAALFDTNRESVMPVGGRALVAVDPSAGGADEAGIVGMVLGSDGRVRVTHDRSGVMRPEQWSRVALELALEIGAREVAYESNLVGTMMRDHLDLAWDALVRDGEARGMKPRLAPVRAKVNKALRAEPVAQAYAEDRVRHVGKLPALEAQCCSWSPEDSDSPDRMDALVHGVTFLLPRLNAGAATVLSPAAITLPRGPQVSAGARTRIR